MHFDEALAAVKQGTQIAVTREAQMTDLRTKPPDVAALVTDGRLTLEAGIAISTRSLSLYLPR
jgi:hypothetical protein